jgi:putative phosphoesterase
MLIGVLSDIHGNGDALEAVLKNAREEKVEHLLILGDLIGYYYDSEEVFNLLDNWNKTIIRGNHEKMFIDMLMNVTDSEAIRNKYGSALHLAIERLSAERIEEITKLKVTEHITIEKITVQMFHGSPWDEEMYVYPDASIDVLKRCENNGVDYVLLGHTHYPFLYKGAQSTVINPGSVGQSRIKGGVADWGVLNTSNHVYRQKSTAYPTKRMKERVQMIDPGVAYLRTILDRNAD